MSGKIQIKFAIREMKIMEDMLSKMGYKINSKNGQLTTTSKSGYQMKISSEGIQFDSVDKVEVDNIKIEYSKAYATSDIESRGELYQVEETADEIIFLVNS